MNICVGNIFRTATEQDFKGRSLMINEVRPRTDCPRTSDGDRGGFGGGRF
jgi:hypothetical protein